MHLQKTLHIEFIGLLHLSLRKSAYKTSFTRPMAISLFQLHFSFMAELIMNDGYGLRKIINNWGDIFRRSQYFNCYVWLFSFSQMKHMAHKIVAPTENSVPEK